MEDFDYKNQKTLQERTDESNRMKSKYPDHVAVIVQVSKHSQIPKLDKSKFLVAKSFTVGQLVYVVRKRIELSSEQAIFLFINNELPSTSQLITQVYNEHKDKDGFLYVLVSGESTFG